MKARAFLLAAFLASTASAADGVLDYSAGAGLRTMPWGSAAGFDVGYGFLVWGARTPGQEASSPLFGYARPYLRVQSSGVVNRADFGLQVFPISVLGFGVNQGFVQRATELATIDCAAVECEGKLLKTRLSAHLTLGYGPAFLLWDVSSETQTPQGAKTRAFGDEASSLVGLPTGDTLVSSDAALGAEIDSAWSGGLALSTAAMTESGANNTLLAVFGRWNFAPSWSALASVGSYRSSTQQAAFSAGLGLSWRGRPGLGLR
jgi:hypothetical protein